LLVLVKRLLVSRLVLKRLALLLELANLQLCLLSSRSLIVV
jgi:hypothetical protein